MYVLNLYQNCLIIKHFNSPLNVQYIYFNMDCKSFNNKKTMSQVVLLRGGVILSCVHSATTS